MKKFLITISAIGAALLLLGVGIFTAVFASNDWDITNIDPETLTADYFETDKEIEGLFLVGTWFYEIELGDSFRIDFYRSDMTTLEISTQIGESGAYTLSFIETQSMTFPNFGLMGVMRATSNMYTVRITVTREIMLQVTASSADITANDINFSRINVSGSSTALNLTNVNVASGIVMTGSSRWMNFYNVTAGSIISEGSNLRAYFNNVIFSDAATFGGSSKSISSNYLTTRNIKLSGSNLNFVAGNLNANNIHADGSSMGINIVDSRLYGIRTEGSNSRITIRNSTVRDVNIVRGSSVRVFAYASHMLSLTSSGSSTRAYLELYGTMDNVRYVEMSGSNTRIYIDGSRQNAQRILGAGENASKTFRLDGSSVRISLSFLGGVSNFAG